MAMAVTTAKAAAMPTQANMSTKAKTMINPSLINKEGGYLKWKPTAMSL
jgi:hypothetical protein